MQDETRLWTAGGVECVMVSCCAGAELQVRKPNGDIILRELYPSKSDLYERSLQLKSTMPDAGDHPPR